MYGAVPRDAAFIDVRNSVDIATLNQLQYSNAVDNIYFRDHERAAIEKLHQRAMARRGQEITSAFEYPSRHVEPDGSATSLLHFYHRDHRIGFVPNFLKIRREGRRFRFDDREVYMRDEERTSAHMDLVERLRRRDIDMATFLHLFTKPWPRHSHDRSLQVGNG